MAGDTGAMRERLLRPFGRFGPAVAALSLCLIGAGGDTSRSGAVEVLSGPVPATVIEVMDGDTVKVRARIWLGQDLSTRVRLAGIDAPELNGGCARERALAERARAFLAGYLAAADGGPVEVRLFEVRYGKYARRVVARMETAEAIDLGAALIAAGLAQPYDGGRRPTWCDESMDITP